MMRAVTMDAAVAGRRPAGPVAASVLNGAEHGRNEHSRAEHGWSEHGWALGPQAVAAIAAAIMLVCVLAG